MPYSLNPFSVTLILIILSSAPPHHHLHCQYYWLTAQLAHIYSLKIFLQPTGKEALGLVRWSTFPRVTRPGRVRAHMWKHICPTLKPVFSHPHCLPPPPHSVPFLVPLSHLAMTNLKLDDRTPVAEPRHKIQSVWLPLHQITDVPMQTKAGAIFLVVTPVGPACTLTQ